MSTTTEHSIYSPSGMSAKLLCLGKHRATLGMNGGSSPAAERGTECHNEAEKLILDPDGYQLPEFKEDWQEQCTRDMVGDALQIIDDLKVLGGECELNLEVKVELGWLATKDVPQMEEVFGTVDVLIWHEETKTLVVLDYKTGKGIVVDPEQNVQLMIYALGALDIYPEAEKVVLAVSQPRVYDELQTWNISNDEICRWGQSVLLPAIKAMDTDNAPRTPGESQCRWCEIKGTCTAQRDKFIDMLDEAPVEKVTSGGLTHSELDGLLMRVKEFKLWINAVEGAAQGIMEDGDDLEHFKLVRGRGSRGWVDEEKADKFLKGQKLKEKERYTYKLLTFPQAEKLLKDKLKKTTVTRNNFYKLEKRKEGKVTWALKTDKREAINVAPPVDELVNMEDLF